MNIPVFSEGNNLIPTVRWNNSYFLADLQASENEIAAASFFLSFPALPAREGSRAGILSAFPMSSSLQPPPSPGASLITPSAVTLAWTLSRGHPVPDLVVQVGMKIAQLLFGRETGRLVCFGWLQHLFVHSFVHSFHSFIQYLLSVSHALDVEDADVNAPRSFSFRAHCEWKDVHSKHFQGTVELSTRGSVRLRGKWGPDT